jgi:integrase
MKRAALSVAKVNGLKQRGFYCDGGGLHLQVAKGGSKSWVFRFTQGGRTRDMGLGSIHTVTLAEAREIAREKRKLLLAAIDPIEARKQERQAKQLEAAKSIAFDECRDRYFAGNNDAWRSAKHRRDWHTSLVTHATPVLGSISVAAIDTQLVLKALEPIWKTKTVTAGRVRGRIETILNWAKTHGYRTGENPAQWAGHLENILPRHSKLRQVQHYAAVPWPEIAAFMGDLGKRKERGAAALAFTILTAARAGEAMGARWPEIDLTTRTWIIPGHRMKAGREHRVPLSAPALKILNALPRRGEIVFASELGKPLRGRVMSDVMRRMGYDQTVHGFRSAFRDWAFERSSFPRDVVEAALAHLLRDQTEAAYRRGDALEKRRRLMEAWGAFCMQPATGKVVFMGAH